MRVILTEEQLKVIKLIKENEDFSDKINTIIKDIKEQLDRLYNIITFTTIAEIRDGETDISVMERKIEEYEDKINNLQRKIGQYFERFDEETFYAKKLDDIQNDLEGRLMTIDRKASALSNIISQLKPFAKVNEYGEGREKDWDAPFDNITPMKL